VRTSGRFTGSAAGFAATPWASGSAHDAHAASAGSRVEQHGVSSVAGTAADAQRLLAVLTGGGRRVVVVGAGWIGLETAAAARGHGNQVSLLEHGPTPLHAVLGPEIGTTFARLHREHGVHLRVRTGVGEFRGAAGRLTAVVTNAGDELPADVAIVGVGARPNTELARAAGFPVDNGVVDAALRTPDPDVYAAGDVANAFHPLLGRHLRVEHWANALHGGPAAARSMHGQAVSYDRVPYFFTDQYDLGMEHSGFAGPGDYDRVVYRGDLDAGEFVAFWLSGDRVVAGMNVNVWGVADPLQRLIRSGAAVDDQRLRRPERPARRARRSPRRCGVNRLSRLRAAGVSIWLDDLSRDLLDSGHFATLIADWAVSGATSNPTIFARAITGSDRYDAQLRAAVAAGVREPRDLFLALALDDVRRAADLLRPAYQASAGRDGFVSFECTPDLADDTAATISQAVGLWHRLDRPNVMIKVPATAAGIPAIEELTARGINVNVTLLFSVSRYQQVIDAHTAGLERRAAAGQDLGRVASAASFFVSRIDARTDPLLPVGSDLHGRIAIANAARAHATHTRHLTGRRWLRRQSLDALPQRPLWASTAVKNRAYSDVLYVESLVAPDVIITMPEATLRAFADHGGVDRTALTAPAGAEQVLNRAAVGGVDLHAVTDQLERAGIKAFCASYHQDLLDCLQAKTSALAAAPART
jgi:transaldolase